MVLQVDLGDLRPLGLVVLVGGYQDLILLLEVACESYESLVLSRQSLVDVHLAGHISPGYFELRIQLFNFLQKLLPVDPELIYLGFMLLLNLLLHGILLELDCPRQIKFEPLHLTRLESQGFVVWGHRLGGTLTLVGLLGSGNSELDSRRFLLLFLLLLLEEGLEFEVALGLFWELRGALRSFLLALRSLDFLDLRKV